MGMKLDRRGFLTTAGALCLVPFLPAVQLQFAALWCKLDGVAQKVQHDLAKSAWIDLQPDRLLGTLE